MLRGGEDCRREYPAYCFASHALRKLPVVAMIEDDGIFAPGLSATIYIIHLSLPQKIIWLQIWMQADIMRQMTAMTTA